MLIFCLINCPNDNLEPKEQIFLHFLYTIKRTLVSPTLARTFVFASWGKRGERSPEMTESFASVLLSFVSCNGLVCVRMYGVKRKTLVSPMPVEVMISSLWWSLVEVIISNPAFPVLLVARIRLGYCFLFVWYDSLLDDLKDCCLFGVLLPVSDLICFIVKLQTAESEISFELDLNALFWVFVFNSKSFMLKNGKNTW